MKKKFIQKRFAVLLLCMTMALTACEGKNQTDGETITQETSQEVSRQSAQSSEEAESKMPDESTEAESKTADESDPGDYQMDYLVLVNKLNGLPADWEEKIQLVSEVNSVGDEVISEKTAYGAYLELKEDVLKNDGIELQLDSAYRSVAQQQDIMNRFIEKYGFDYAVKTVALPGYSEHHTGLALDLYFRLDGKDVYYNEDMVQYPEVWEKIHARLADHGFILRYLEGKEHITGYGYEPWHIRYVGVDVARQIMAKPGLTLEVWLGEATDPDVTIDYGTSSLYDKEDLDAAIVQIKCKFASFRGCELHAIRYAGDEFQNEKNLKWMNELDPGKDYVQVAKFTSAFHMAFPNEMVVCEPDTEYTDYEWWLARTADGGWQLLTFGY